MTMEVSTFSLQIRYVGLSNETPYGVMKFIQVAEKYACYPKIVSLQVSFHSLPFNSCPYLLFYFHHGTLTLSPANPSIEVYFLC